MNFSFYLLGIAALSLCSCRSQNGGHSATLGAPYSIVMLPQTEDGNIIYTYDARASEDIQLHSISGSTAQLRAEGVRIFAQPGAQGELQFTGAVGLTMHSITVPTHRPSTHTIEGIAFTVTPAGKDEEGNLLICLSRAAEESGKERIAALEPHFSSQFLKVRSLRNRSICNNRISETFSIAPSDTVELILTLRNAPTTHTIKFVANPAEDAAILLLPGFEEARKQAAQHSTLPIAH